MKTRLIFCICLLSACLPDKGANEDDVAGDSTGDSTSETTYDGPPVECGSETCEAGLLCVHPGLHCTDNGFVQPASFCSAMPEPCIGLVDAELDMCMWTHLCLGVGEGFGFDMGAVMCPADAEDCHTDPIGESESTT